MDDYNIVSLQESTNEWVSRLINIFTPCVIDGLRAVFDEALSLCIENDEVVFLNGIMKYWQMK